MTVKEQLTQAKDALAALKERIEACDAEAIEQGESLVEQINELEAKAKKSAKAESLISQIGVTTMPETIETIVKSIGDAAVKSVANVERGTRFSVSAEFKAATDTHVEGTPVPAAMTDYDRNVYGYRHNLSVRSLFAAETISGGALTYYVEGTAAGTPAVTAEGAAKPQINLPSEAKTVALAKVACFLKESDELIADARWMAEAINNRGVYMLQTKEESKLVTDLAGTSGIQAKTGGISFDAIMGAISDVQSVAGFAADAILMNPADYQTLACTKTETGRNDYVLGGPAASALKTIWGLPVVCSSAVTSGTCFVGAFKIGASVVAKDGIRVETTNANEDDFTKNIVCIRIEERLALAVRYPKAFVKISA